VSVCPYLFRGKITSSKEVSFELYRTLHEDGRKIIKDWFNRALDNRDCKPDESFEPFIYLWISFNAWGSCVTKLERDSDIVRALAINEKLNKDFDELRQTSEDFKKSCDEFHKFWPIFKVQALRKEGIVFSGKDRREMIENYLNAGVKDFEPKCWKVHRDNGQTTPADWAHTLKAIYRVRCNLFHGEKGRHSENDQKIVHLSFKILLPMFEKQLDESTGKKDISMD